MDKDFIEWVDERIADIQTYEKAIKNTFVRFTKEKFFGKTYYRVYLQPNVDMSFSVKRISGEKLTGYDKHCEEAIRILSHTKDYYSFQIYDSDDTLEKYVNYFNHLVDKVRLKLIKYSINHYEDLTD